MHHQEMQILSDMYRTPSDGVLVYWEQCCCIDTDMVAIYQATKWH